MALNNSLLRLCIICCLGVLFSGRLAHGSAPIVTDLPKELYFGELETIPRLMYIVMATGDTAFTCAVTTTGTPTAANGDEFEVNQNSVSGVWEVWTTCNDPFDDTVTLIYTVTVICTDNAAQSSAPLALTMEVINNEVVTADNAAHDVSALNTNTGDTVATVTSTSNLGHDIVYNMTTNEYFMVDASSGVITAKKPLETIDTATSVMLLTVTAHDTTDQILVYNVKTLNFIEQNTVPSTSALPLSETRPEDTAFPTTLFTLTNDDPDAGQTFTNRFTCVPPAGEDIFEIATGGIFRVQSGQSLDFESATSFVCQFYITDGIEEGGPFTYTLTLTDVNEAPVFSKQMYHATFTEETSGVNVDPGLVCTDVDAGDTTTYVFASVNNSDRFNIDPNSGRMNFSINYDSDTLPRSTVLAVYCIDSGGSTGIVMTGTSYITVTINDVNDNAPVFTSPTTAVNIDESVTPGSSIGTLVVTDADDGQNGVFTCNAATSTSPYAQYFSVTNGCRVFLVSSTEIPTDTRISFTVNATDQGTPALTGQGGLDIFFSRTTTTTIFTTTEYNFFDHDENIAAFVFALIGGLLLLGLLTYCLLKYCCGDGSVDCLRRLRRPRASRRFPKRSETPESYRRRRPETPEYERKSNRPPTYDRHYDNQFSDRYSDRGYNDITRKMYTTRPVRPLRVAPGFPAAGSMPGYINYA